MFQITMGHILDSHAFDEGKKYVKSMFCKDLSNPLVLRNLIIFAFVTTFRDPNSNGPTTVSRWAKCPDYSVVRYSFPYGLGWSCKGCAPPTVCTFDMCTMGIRCTFARHGHHELSFHLASFGLICVILILLYFINFEKFFFVYYEF